MNIKSLIATFALVTSVTTTAAMADVSAQGGVTVGTSFSIRDHRTPTPRPVYQPVYQPGVRQPVVVRPKRTIRNTRNDSRHDDWRPRLNISYPNTTPTDPNYVGSYVWTNQGLVTQPTAIETGREDFWIGAEKGLFNTVELQNVAGESNVTSLLVEFTDHTTQQIRVGRQVCANEQFSFDLAGSNRQIARVAVYGSSNNSSAYQVILK